MRGAWLVSVLVPALVPGCYLYRNAGLWPIGVRGKGADHRLQRHASFSTGFSTPVHTSQELATKQQQQQQQQTTTISLGFAPPSTATRPRHSTFPVRPLRYTPNSDSHATADEVFFLSEIYDFCWKLDTDLE